MLCTNNNYYNIFTLCVNINIIKIYSLIIIYSKTKLSISLKISLVENSTKFTYVIENYII